VRGRRRLPRPSCQRLLVCGCLRARVSSRTTLTPCPGAAPLAPDALGALPAALPALFTFALTWSLGASCNKAGRTAFDAHVRDAVAGLPTALALPASAAPLPPAGTDLYEWAFEAGARGGRGWVPWMDTAAAEYRCNPDLRFSQIVVPTVDTVRGWGETGALPAGVRGG
jgi:dynein heavy chain